MRPPRNAFTLLLGFLYLATMAASPVGAEDTTTTPFDGVQYVHRHVSSPREIDMHLVLVDLKRPGVRVVTTGPNEDPDTETDVETTPPVKHFNAISGNVRLFDGGGSATIVMTDPASGKPQVLNRPSDGRERRVGNNLGIVLESKK